LRRDPRRPRRRLRLGRYPRPGPARGRRRGDHLPERDRRGRRAARRRRPGRLALRQVRRYPAVLLRPGHGRARRRPAGPAAECAAMALHAFGPAVDVQAGGGDLVFPHHAYQAALAETFTGVTPFSRSRLNAGVVRVSGAKMAKSAGNLVLVSDLLEEHSAAAVRLLILDRRWDQDWDFSLAGLDAAAARLERLHAAAGRPERKAAGDGGPAVAAMRAA